MNEPVAEKKDLKTTITVISLILRALEWWHKYRESKKSKG